MNTSEHDAKVMELIEAAREAGERLTIYITHTEDLIAHMRLVRAIDALSITTE